jgi:hypothetical protein
MDTFGKITVTLALVCSLGLVGFAKSQPALTEVQKLRIERLNLVSEITTLTKENADLKVQLAGMKVSLERLQLQQDIERTNPGHTWDPATGQFAPKGPDGELR